MARPAGTHPENRPRPLRSSARVFRLGQMEFRRRSPVDRSNRINSHSNSPLAPCFFSSPRYDGCVSQSHRDLTLPGLSEASSVASPASAAGRGRLLQVLGMGFGMAVAIGNAIAAGIVRTPGEIAKSLPNRWLFMGVWGACGSYGRLWAASLSRRRAAISRIAGQYSMFRRAVREYA